MVRFSCCRRGPESEGEYGMVDPVVVRRKFDHQISTLLLNREALRRERGWIIEEVSFPSLFVIFTVPFPPAFIALFGVELDFTDYNLYPLSARFFDPVTRRSLRRDELPPALQMVGERQQDVIVAVHPTTKLPFFCMRGFREYHDHPQHTDDPWDQYRYNTMIGTAFYCLDQIWQRTVRGLSPTLGVTFVRRGKEVSVNAQ